MAAASLGAANLMSCTLAVLMASIKACFAFFCRAVSRVEEVIHQAEVEVASVRYAPVSLSTRLEQSAQQAP